MEIECKTPYGFFTLMLRFISHKLTLHFYVIFLENIIFTFHYLHRNITECRRIFLISEKGQGLKFSPLIPLRIMLESLGMKEE